MLGIRQKLSFGFAGLLLFAALMGFYSIVLFRHLGQSMDVILRENYRSVVACQEMTEALERMDIGAVFVLSGEDQRAEALISTNTVKFQQALDVELHNITVPGEKAHADRLGTLFVDYQKVLVIIQNRQLSIEQRHETYFSSLLPLFNELKDESQAILQMNQDQMQRANGSARKEAKEAIHSTYVLLGITLAVAAVYIFFTGLWILKPVKQLTDSANEIRKGNLDLVVQASTRDEMGQLLETFNAMAASLREMRRSNRIELLRQRRATEEVFQNLPTPIAMLDRDGRVEIATDAAVRHFGLKPGMHIKDLQVDWVSKLMAPAGDVSDGAKTILLQRFINNREYFFEPLVLPIKASDSREHTGTILILNDVTRTKEQEEMKKGAISTVSHQLKTPLTSVRMSIHLLLEEAVGSLNENQIELLMAAREESDRLSKIIDELLDITRMESGKLSMSLKKAAVKDLIAEALEQFRLEAKDLGIDLRSELTDDLPDVFADPSLIHHVFQNLVSNALKYTRAGGTVTVSAMWGEGDVRFSVADTGRGIPQKYLSHVFERFFRVPQEHPSSGIGLGLAIVREIVSAHGGRTGVESTEGSGSTFWFTLPAAKTETQMMASI